MKNQVVVVTGAGRGIGEAIAHRFADIGFRVALLARTTDELQKVEHAIKSKGQNAYAISADITKPETLLNAMQSIHTIWGPVTILINNAGNVIRKPLAEMTTEEWTYVLDTNLTGTFHMTQACLKDICEQKGSIINISSIAGRHGTPYLSAYCAAKHGVVGFTKSLAEELRQDHVAVNAICPGSVDTRMLQEGLPGAKPNMLPDDIAQTALFLATQAPKALTGSCIDVFG